MNAKKSVQKTTSGREDISICERLSDVVKSELGLSVTDFVRIVTPGATQSDIATLSKNLKDRVPGGTTLGKIFRAFPLINPHYVLIGTLPKLLKSVDYENSAASAPALGTLPDADPQNVAQCITDDRGITVFVDEAFERMTGYKKKEVIGKKPGDKLQDFDMGTERDVALKMTMAIKNGESFSGVITNFGKGKKKLKCFLEMSPVKKEDGTVTGFVSKARFVPVAEGVNEEITRSVQAKGTLEIMHEEIEALKKWKEEVLRDIKTVEEQRDKQLLNMRINLANLLAKLTQKSDLPPISKKVMESAIPNIANWHESA